MTLISKEENILLSTNLLRCVFSASQLLLQKVVDHRGQTRSVTLPSHDVSHCFFPSQSGGGHDVSGLQAASLTLLL